MTNIDSKSKEVHPLDINKIPKNSAKSGVIFVYHKSVDKFDLTYSIT